MVGIIHLRFIISRQKMCNRFLQYLEKKFSCFGQDVNDDNSAEERSDRDDHSSSQSENSSSERESFKSYSDDDDEEGAGEDVVESTGRSRTRDSSYEDCYSKAIGSTTNSIRNVESLKSFNEPSRKNSPEEKTNKYVPVKIRSKVGSQKINQEIPEKLSKSDTSHAKQTRQQPEGRKVSSKTATTTLTKENIKKKADKLSNKASTAKEDTNFKKKDDKKAVGKQDRKKTPVGEKKSALKSKEEKKNFSPKSVDKPKEKLEKERKSPPKEKRKTEEVKQNGKHLEAVAESSKKLKSKSNKAEKMNSVPLQNKTVANKKLEPKMPKIGLKKNNISRAGTFSKRTSSLPGRSVPKFTSKSIHKRRLTK